ncbi:SDR family oxidoreductase [Microbacterium allomyrinae]|uniref:SDR family oxidoreductase n=1 Tax=Microbacterium allomyrinae TaxID=2830666 RepID=A0A9X1LWJ4_9MICO|nr:SDR family oxidoreductase [Microbacterium allomyrinae]MCC2032948.1 SDR family oxidoreductase [Microbacterium allomyrinae]
MTTSAPTDPTEKHHSGGFPAQEQEQPGLTDETRPTPDHGERSYRGSRRLSDRRALVTGGDSGIGRAVAIAFAREGADVALTHLPEEQDDADETARWVTEAGPKALALAGDLQDEDFCAEIVERTVAELGGLDVLVLNAAYQKDRDGLESLETAEIDRVFRTNLYAPMFTARAAIPHLKPGSSIIVTTSIQAFNPSPALIDYAMTKAAHVAFVKALAEELGPRGIRVNGVAPGPIWTPLIPATGWDAERLATFGTDTPLGRAGQPAELAGAYVYLASEDASYTSGAILPVTGGKPL